MKLRIYIATLFLSFLSLTSFGQIVINSAPTAADLVTNTLIGSGLTTSNITFVGNANQKGYFDGSASNIGLPEGVVLSAGNVNNIVFGSNPSTDYGGAGDADVLATAQSVTSNPAVGSINSTFDAAVLEFDFVPDGNEVVFTFVFASEEYTTYINTQYNDAFGFYLTGPNPAGGSYNVENLALVPGTTEPITISTIHPGLNAAYYVSNTGGTTHSFNGFTVPIEIRFAVECGQTYHFKFAVADCQDGILDTAVFLEGGSFQSVPVDLTFQTSTGDTTIFEGCNTFADIIFTRPTCQSIDTLIADVSYGGTATNGADYTFLPDSVIFLPGQDTVTLLLEPIADGVYEGPEQITITLTSILANGDTIITIATGWILDQPDIEALAADTAVYCIQDSVQVFASATGGLPPYTYSWSTGSTTNSTWVPATANGTYEYYVTVTDDCGFQDTDTLDFIVNQTLAIDTVISYPSSVCNPTGAVSGFASGLTGVPYYNWTGPGPNSPNFIDATVWQNISPGWYYFTVSDNVCEVNDSVYVDVEPGVIAAGAASPNYGCAPLTVSFSNSSQNATTYQWDFGGGNIVNTNNTNPITQTFTSSVNVMLIANDATNCPDTAYIAVIVDPCGCTDPLALNYNPLATIDDESCIYPLPTVVAPNVFTPNGDNENDLFELDHQFAINIELVIMNRWGNVMYESEGPNPVWDGKSQSSANATEGTYFYKYAAYGAGGDVVEGHGFVQLIRD